MPNTASAAKRVRQNEKRRLLNKARKTELKTIRKHLERAIHDKQGELAESLLRRLTKRTDQAASRGVLHKNCASRRKAVMAKKVQALHG